MTGVELDHRNLLDRVQAFIFKEARLQDEHQYEAWEALWTDDGVYWVPANGDSIDHNPTLKRASLNWLKITRSHGPLVNVQHTAGAPVSVLKNTPSLIAVCSGRNRGAAGKKQAPVFGYGWRHSV